MVKVNGRWIEKEGEFFVEWGMIVVGGIMWYLKI